MASFKLSKSWGEFNKGAIYKGEGNPWDRVQFPGADNSPCCHFLWVFGYWDGEHPGGSHLAGNAAFGRGSHTTHCGLLREKMGCKYPRPPFPSQTSQSCCLIRTYRRRNSLPEARSRKTESRGCPSKGRSQEHWYPGKLLFLWDWRISRQNPSDNGLIFGLCRKVVKACLYFSDKLGCLTLPSVPLHVTPLKVNCVLNLSFLYGHDLQCKR